ncbi:MAG: hypothetical protein M0T77_07555 [Actinomycetota bacterium]|nr:hypothetical protein [Actinomycetota bacterium]
MVDNGAAGGSDAVTIYRTTDAGRRWVLLARSPTPAGRPGTRGAPSVGCEKTGFSFSGPAQGWITGYCAMGMVLQESVDGGRIWRETGIRVDDWGIDEFPPRFFGPETGVMAGGVGTRTGVDDTVFTTTDAGVRWIAHRPPRATSGPIDVISGTTWLIARGETLYLTRDAGADWTTIRSSLPLGSIDASALDFVNASDGWALTFTPDLAGTLWHTTDGGRSWKQV